MNAAAERPAPAARTEPPAPAFDVADDDYITGAQLKKLIAASAEKPNATAVELAASANRGYAEQKYATEFAKYGGEIDAMLQGVPKHLWTLDNLARVVKMVRSDHLDEIIAQERTRLVDGMEPALRSNGAAAPPAPALREQSLESEKIPADWKDRAKRAGVTEKVVEDFCRANDMTPEAFYKQFETPRTRIVEEISVKQTGA